MAPGGARATPVEPWRGLSDQQWLLDYILCRPDAKEIIGEGAVEVYRVFLEGRDPNMHQPRWDFVLYRADNTIARIHPSSSSHGHPVICPKELLVWHGVAPATTRGNIGRAAEGVFTNYHQCDLISKSKARVFLQKCLQR